MTSPPPPVERAWHAVAADKPHLILPDGCVDIIEQHGRLRVVGPMTHSIWVRVAPTEAHGWRFHPGAVRSWLGISPHDLVDTVVDGDAIPALRDKRRLAELTKLLVDHHHAPSLIRRAVCTLAHAPNTPIETIAQEHGTTSRHLRRRFQLEVGLSPKRFARIQRLQHAVSALRRRMPSSLAEVALSAGYADQAHMSREVRAFTGESPTTLRSSL